MSTPKPSPALIAAAPELLEALKYVDHLLTQGILIRSIPRDFDFASEMKAMMHDLNKIKLAIAKAERQDL
jgi:hypothetical protein